MLICTIVIFKTTSFEKAYGSAYDTRDSLDLSPSPSRKASTEVKLDTSQPGKKPSMNLPLLNVEIILEMSTLWQTIMLGQDLKF
jgi:hypothetical protein